MNRIVKSLENIAKFDALSHNVEAKYSVYVLEVIPLSESCKYDLYVGSTWKSVEERFEEHKNGGTRAARLFRKSAKVGAIRWDIMEGFPKFHSRDAVERAEGRVAIWLTNKGFTVRSDKLESEE